MPSGARVLSGAVATAVREAPRRCDPAASREPGQASPVGRRAFAHLGLGLGSPRPGAASAAPAAYLQTSDAPVLGTPNFWKSGDLVRWFCLCVILS